MELCYLSLVHIRAVRNGETSRGVFGELFLVVCTFVIIFHLILLEVGVSFFAGGISDIEVQVASLLYFFGWV